MRFGLALPQYEYSLVGDFEWADLAEWARRAEALGFDSIWVSDHLWLDTSKYGGPSDPRWAFESFTTLAALAAVTERVRVGCLVVCNDLRPPSLVAKMAATLNTLVPGRIVLGMGAGWYEPEFEAAGVPFRPPGERVERLGEALQLVRQLLASSPVRFEGANYQVNDAWNLPVGVEPPPIWVGGKGDRIMRIAARQADGYNLVWASTPQDYSRRVGLIRSAASHAGRNPDAISLSLGLYTVPGHDHRQVQDRFLRYVESSPPGVGARLRFEDWAKDKLTGTPEEIASLIGEFDAVGVEEIILGFGLLPFQIADEEAVDWFASEVIPLVNPSIG